MTRAAAPTLLPRTAPAPARRVPLRPRMARGAWRAGGGGSRKPLGAASRFGAQGRLHPRALERDASRRLTRGILALSSVMRRAV